MGLVHRAMTHMPASLAPLCCYLAVMVRLACMRQIPLFAKGDTVVVVKGDLSDLMGTVLGVRQVSRSV